MNEIITKLSKPLNPAEIELRIGSVSENKGFSLLVYKTARTDIKRLNEVCGVYWKNKFFYDEQKLLCCEILIYDSEIKEWIGRSDVGIESKTEKEKGSYSDARKRAGFCWGIGIELYEFPFIWIQWNKWHKNLKGKSVPTVYPNNWSVEYEGKDFKSGIIIKNEKNSVIWKSGVHIEPDKITDDTQSDKTETPNKETQFEYLRDNTRKIATGMYKNVKYDSYRKLISEIGKSIGTAENIGLLKRSELQLNIISLMARIDGELDDSQIEHYQNRISKAKMDELKTIKVEFEKLFKAMEVPSK